MPRSKDERNRVLGPVWIPSRDRWRVTFITPKADQPEERSVTRYFREEAEAHEIAEKARQRFARLSYTTLEEAIQEYLTALKERETSEVYREEITRRLPLFFSEGRLPVARLTPERCQGYYDAFRARRKPNGEAISVAYHRGVLADAKAFLRWCVTREWMQESPIEKVRGVGKRKSGKVTLTGDEARRLYRHCLSRAQLGDDAALAILLLLTLALRQADVLQRLVRDVDLNATVLRVSKGKTEKSNRPRHVPAALQQLLRNTVAGRDPLALLFPALDGRQRTGNWLRFALRRFCRDAGVPLVCPHSLKGTAGNVLADLGTQVEQIAAYLSHEGSHITERHYLTDGVVANAQSQRMFAVLSGDDA